MHNQEKKRLSYNIRLRPYTGSSLDLVVSWLKSLDPQDKRLKVEEALTMMFAVQAKISSDVDPVEIQKTYLLTKQALDKHCANLELQYPNLLTSNQEASSNTHSKVQNRDQMIDTLFS